MKIARGAIFESLPILFSSSSRKQAFAKITYASKKNRESGMKTEEEDGHELTHVFWQRGKNLLLSS